MKRALTLAICIATLMATSPLDGQKQQPLRKSAVSALRIVSENLIETATRSCDRCYVVEGSIYNTSNDGISDVTIKYFVWKQLLGKDGLGEYVKQTGGLAVAKIRYLPPKQIVQFTATGSRIGIASLQSGLVPDPLDAEITAEWDDK